jgi:hypothetical protein
MNCSVLRCEAVAWRRGLCCAHYTRQRKHGDPLAGGTPKGELLHWLKRHANYPADECLTWPFGDRGNGYGSVKFRGKHTSASRVMCLLAHGEPTAPDADAAHSCGNGHLGCVNPRHLRWATRLENVRDAISHGSTSRGAKHSAAIKQAFAEIPIAARKEAARLGVDVQTLTKEAREQAA